jgi:solute carrier family 35 (UDP-galactose transporter), member B1
MMVSGFGPLPCSVVTTTRKFFTVLFSVIFFGNSLTNRQWLGTVLVFSGLFADMFLGKKPAVNDKKDDSKRLLQNQH